MLALVALALAQTVTIPEGSALTAEIQAADTALFRTYFEACDPAALTAMVTDDFEMYHDKGGQVFTTGAAFVADYARDCELAKAPDGWHSRRALVPASLHVESVPGFGAIEEGDHHFYERKGDGSETLVGKAHFVHVWQRAPDGWRLKRVLSYSHRAVE